METTANEFAYRLINKSNSVAIELDQKAKLIGKNKKIKFERLSILLKYECLVLLTENKIDKGSECYQNVDFVIKIRNGFTHYKAAWLDLYSEGWEERSESINHDNNFINLKKFYVKGLNQSSNKIWVTALSAKYAIESVINFIKYFFELMENCRYTDCMTELFSLIESYSLSKK